MAEHTYGPEKMREMAGLLRNPPVQFTEDWEEDLQLRVLIGAMRNAAEVLDCAATDQDSLLRVVKAAMERIKFDGMWGPTTGPTMWDARRHLAWREEEIAALAALPAHLAERLANVSPEIAARLSEGE